MARPSPFSSLMQRRTSSFLHYQTFPTTPPAASGPPPAEGDPSLHQTLSGVRSDGASSRTCGTSGGGGHTPVPMSQLVILAVISLAEQTALNSISPYLPEMVRTFPGVDKKNTGLSVGIIASSFAAAQFSSQLCLFHVHALGGGGGG